METAEHLLPAVDLTMTPTPDTLTFDDIMDAVHAGIVPYSDGWDAFDKPGAPGRGEARQRICEAIKKQREGLS